VRTAEAWFRIVRPPIVIISVVGVSVGALNVTLGRGEELVASTYGMTCLMAGLLAAGLMVHNDYYDLPSDRVTRPKKALPSGAIKARTARDVGFALMAFAVVTGLLVRFPATGELDIVTALIAALVFLVGLYYNIRGKHAGLLGHVMVAFGVGLIPYMGAVPFGDYANMLPLAAGIAVMEVGREVMVCAGDIEGDRAAGFSTLPVRIGQRRSLLVALGFYIASAPLFFIYLPTIAGRIYGEGYHWVEGKPWVDEMARNTILDLNMFGNLYFVGAAAFLVALIALWWLVWRKPVWESFERYIRTGSRVLIFLFQLLLISEAFV
jgi:geranylgeranylglycerol-phosphate geranylgeranyltransferase